MNNKKWTNEEIDFLIENYKTGGLTATEISKKIDRTIQAIRLKAFELNLNSDQYKRKFYLNEDFFAQINNADKAYILGFWYADGCISSNVFDIVQKKEDDYLLLKIKSAMEYAGPLREITNKNCGNIYSRLTIGSKKIVNDLKKLGATEKKSLAAEYPQIKDEYFSHFVRGYFDGDGSVFYEKKNGKTHIKINITGGEPMLSHIKDEFAKRFKIDLNLYPVRRSKGCFILQAFGKKAVLFLNEIYKPIKNKETDFYLLRKYEKYKPFDLS